MKKLIAITTLTLVTTSAVFAHSGVKDEHVLARMKGMSALSEDMKIIGGMAKGEAAFDAEAVNDALARMSEESARIEGLFETRADDPKSEARALIWEDFSGFTEKADDLTKVTAGLSGTIQSADDLGPLLKQVGKSCSTCHSDYRE
tara:strand:+ start:2040 stop:2477 length:438 start_codon:yes stop_codon:yes gene_type:complete